MKSCYSNLADQASFFRVVKLLPVLLLPVGLMGVTAPSYLGYRLDSKNQSIAEQGHEQAQQRKRTWEAMEPIDKHLGELRKRNRFLEEMIPEWQEEIMAHGAIRKAAEDVGLELERIVLEEPVKVSEPLNGKVIVERKAVVSGSGKMLSGLRLVAELRNQGWPMTLHSLDIDKSISDKSAIQHSLTVGFFHYAVATDYQVSTSMEENTTSAVEAKVQ
ncbi:MAG: Tfp pilus assembly protein PilO [Glaciecola sp.]|jgi:Tfp pilus assembly protein PilO